MLTINKIEKTFLKNTPNELHALRGLNLHLNKGEFVTIVGSNGAGKSTLFNAISGSFWIDSGSITLDHQDITYMPEHRRAAIVGRLFQDPMKGTAPGMTIHENLALAYSRSKRRGLQIALRKKETELFREALSEFGMGLEDRMDTRVGLLSGGQRQALTLLMSTIVTPKLLLLDEHTAALDPATAEKVMDITNKIVAKDTITTMMITHNLNSALKTGTRTIMMNAGNIVLDISGKERESMTVPQLLDLYSKKSETELATDRILLAEK
ncbi:MAG: ATP-binding cassette domain-containing protein [Lachnospiraceae bacterium]|nr:ATP-binding cassette domain-containing protein [Lachnospiraceae bacterium]